MGLFLLSIPLALLWMMLTSNVSFSSFGVGYVISLAVMLLVHSERKQFQWRHLPNQVWAFVVYTVTLGRDIVLSSVDVSRRVLQRDMPLSPGIIAVATQDADEDEVIAAFSAHGITLTPGELVLDFDGSHTLYVHCIDVDASTQNAPPAQTKRLRLLKQILGRPVR
jgi:multicomponent Na+:H+ antiporter subunit E